MMGLLFTAHPVCVGFFNFSSNGSLKTLGCNNSVNGVALYSLLYPNDTCAYAYNATVLNCTDGAGTVQNVVSSPVQLTVGVPTRLQSWVESGYSQTERYVAGYLVENPYGWPANGLGNMTITVRINQTEFNMTTSNDPWLRWYFSYERDFLPDGNESALYTITASFNGEAPLSSTVWAKTLDGQDYAVCTTSQYAYRPCYNVTCLTVEPISSVTSMLVKTPEEMRQEAEQTGLFKVDAEFSWWYPWFRLHYKLNANLPQGNPKLDYGWSPLPFGESYSASDAAVANLMNDASGEGDPMAIADLAAGSVIQIGIYLLMGKSVVAIASAIILYAAYTLYRTLQAISIGTGSNRWLVAFVATLIGVGGGLALEGLANAGKFLTSTARAILSKVSWVASLHGFGLNFFDITMLAFALIDFVSMTICISMFLGSL